MSLEKNKNIENNSWQRFRKNPLSIVSLYMIGLFILVAVFAYLIIPDKSPHANSQHIELAAKKPGTKVSFLKVIGNENPQKQGFLSKIFTGRNNKYKYVSFLSYTFKEDSIILRDFTDFPEEDFFYTSFHIAEVIYGNSVAEYLLMDRDKIKLKLANGEEEIFRISEGRKQIEEQHIVSRKFLLGTDRFGRDMLSRIILGTRVSLSVGFISVFISLFIGTFLGSLAGYYGGMTDKSIMWLINVVWSVPTLLLVISLTMVLGKGFWQIFIAVGISMWVEVARVVRGQVMSIRKKEYVEAAIVLGIREMRILFGHILPNIISPLVIIAASNFAAAILIEAGLSFLGIGVQPPLASWGTMIRDHYGFIIVDKAFLAFIPGLAIMLLVLAFTLVGNGLRDAFDVKSE